MLQYSHHPSPFPVGALIVAELLFQTPIRPLPCSRPTRSSHGEDPYHNAAFIASPLLGVRAAEWQGRPGKHRAGGERGINGGDPARSNCGGSITMKQAPRHTSRNLVGASPFPASSQPSPCPRQAPGPGHAAHTTHSPASPPATCSPFVPLASPASLHPCSTSLTQQGPLTTPTQPAESSQPPIVQQQ